MPSTGYSFVGRALPPTPPRPFAVFAVYFEGKPVTDDGEPVEHGTMQAASDRADQIAQAWDIDRERLYVERVWL